MAKSSKALGVNPAILQWARMSMQLEISEVAELCVKLEPQKSYASRLAGRTKAIADWEAGMELPSIAQLQHLAEKVYRRPFLLFFFPEPPNEGQIDQQFRTSLAHLRLSPDTIFKLRLARVRQIELHELFTGVNPAEHRVFSDLALVPTENPTSAAQRVRKYFAQQNGALEVPSGSNEALSFWRSRVEKLGVFVFKDTFKQTEVSGFCVFDPVFPVIYLNNSTTKTRQVFTLFHELAHILLKSNSILVEDVQHPTSIFHSVNTLERFCDNFAAEFLVPGQELRLQASNYSSAGMPDSELIPALAKGFGVSREVVVRKLYELKVLSDEQKREWLSKLYAEYQKKRKAGKGGDYYATQLVYLGMPYARKVIADFSRGAMSLEDAAGYLAVKPKNVPELQERLS